jgi:hypothetical protein
MTPAARDIKGVALLDRYFVKYALKSPGMNGGFDDFAGGVRSKSGINYGVWFGLKNVPPFVFGFSQPRSVFNAYGWVDLDGEGLRSIENFDKDWEPFSVNGAGIKKDVPLLSPNLMQ